MKIVEIVTQLDSGGAERFTVDLCNELSKNNDVTLIALYSLEEHGFYAQEVSERVTLISLNMQSRRDYGIFFRIWKAVKAINPDVVHTHLKAIPCAILPIFFLRKIAYFHTVHNDARKEAKDIISATARKICFRNKLVTPVTISKESNRSFIEYYGFDTKMIFNGRDVSSEVEVSQSVKDEFGVYRRDSQTKVLVCLARINEIKRQTMLTKIVARLNGEGYNLSLLFIGSTRREDVVAEIQSYSCSNVYILGERHNPLEYMKMADAYCLCSSHEGMPISFIEALGVGAVPVCTPVGGIVDVIEDGVNGFISSDLSEESYYNRLKRFLDLSPESLSKVKGEAVKSYAPFSMTECAKAYLELFSKVVI